MTFKEAVESKRPFKRKDGSYWCIVNELGEIKAYDYPDYRIYLTTGFIFAEDFVIKEEWYENFKKKYPNGVWCKVWDDIDKNIKHYRVVIDYKKNLPFPFITQLGSYTYAEPTKEGAPVIIE